MSASDDKTQSFTKSCEPVPAALEGVALIDGPSIAAAAHMGMSQFYEEVRTGNAPQPVIRRPRFTRWRLSDAKRWLEDLAAGADHQAAAKVIATAHKASAASKKNRVRNAAQIK
jgi:predicted DNA-binding transcriptional regulator AlpA